MISRKQLLEMAQDLEAGMKLYINTKTFEYRSVLDWDEMYDPEPWEEESEKIESEWAEHICVEKLDSRESFQVMEDFIDEIKDKQFQENLIKILNRKSPFANFKYEIESSEYRHKWFAFRTERHIDYIKENLKYNDIAYE